jgi:hypothetical protein
MLRQHFSAWTWPRQHAFIKPLYFEPHDAVDLGKSTCCHHHQTFHHHANYATRSPFLKRNSLLFRPTNLLSAFQVSRQDFPSQTEANTCSRPPPVAWQSSHAVAGRAPVEGSRFTSHQRRVLSRTEFWIVPDQVGVRRSKISWAEQVGIESRWLSKM